MIEYLLPIADLSPLEWELVGETAHYLAIDDDPDSSDAAKIQVVGVSSPGKQDRIRFAPPTMPDDAVTYQVDVYAHPAIILFGPECFMSLYRGDILIGSATWTWPSFNKRATFSGLAFTKTELANLNILLTAQGTFLSRNYQFAIEAIRIENYYDPDRKRSEQKIRFTEEPAAPVTFMEKAVTVRSRDFEKPVRFPG